MASFGGAVDGVLPRRVLGWLCSGGIVGEDLTALDLLLSVSVFSSLWGSVLSLCVSCRAFLGRSKDGAQIARSGSSVSVFYLIPFRIFQTPRTPVPPSPSLSLCAFLSVSLSSSRVRVNRRVAGA